MKVCTIRTSETDTLSLASSIHAGTEGGLDLATRTIRLPGATSQPVPATVVEIGSGRTVVFLHGLVGLNDHWEEVVNRVKSHVRCVMLQLPLLDLRGEDCSINGVTELTIRFLREHVSNRAVLVGNSFGGHVALRVALEAPELVSGMVLAGSSGLIERSMVSEVQIKPSREWLARKIGELFYRPELHMRECDLDRAHKALTDRNGARAMVKLSRSARRNHLGSRIGDIEAPTLLIWGRNDVVTPPEAATEFLERLPNARIVWFPQCGHVPMVEKPDEFARAMLEFTADLDALDART